MAKRTKYLIDPGDAKVVMTCVGCKSAVSLSLGGEHARIPPSCPGCGCEFNIPMHAPTGESMDRHRLLDEAFSKKPDLTLPYTISLEVDIGDGEPQANSH